MTYYDKRRPAPAGPLIDRSLWLSLRHAALLQCLSEAITTCHVERGSQGLSNLAEDEGDGDQMANVAQSLSRECRIVLVSGFESFNVELYKKVRQCVLLLSLICAADSAPKPLSKLAVLL